MRGLRIVAHRGASCYEPENTLRAIRRAIELHADMIEVDAHATKEGQLVVIHDPTVDRTTNGKGSVREMLLKDLRKLDAGKGEKIPTLQEVLVTAGDKIGVMIEVKAANIEKPLLDLLQREGMLKQVIITSFMSDVVKKIRELHPTMMTGQIFSWKIPNIAKKASELRVNLMLPEYELVTSEMVRELHKSSVFIYTWTVDDRRVAETLIEAGVEGIITNKPDLMFKKE